MRDPDGPPVFVAVSKDEGGGEKRREVSAARQLKPHV